jgi:hypothetical protein
MSDSHEWFDTPAASAYLGGRPRPRTLEKLRVTGGGPVYHKHLSCVVYRREDLDAWAAARRRTSTSDPGPEGSGPEREG